jgi:hypothetical protein
MRAAPGAPRRWPFLPCTHGERQRLADQRAEVVWVQLLGMGVPPARVTASGNPNSQYMDGRVELVLTPLVSG